MYELIVVWGDGSRNVYEYDSEDSAIGGIDNFRMAFGNQIAWIGIRRVDGNKRNKDR